MSGARRVVKALAAVLLVAGFRAGTASADVTVRVSTPQDETTQDSQCSLREALTFASDNLVPDCSASHPVGLVTIIVPAGCYRLSSGVGLLAPVLSPVTAVAIAGAGAGPAGCGGGGTVIDAQQTGPAISFVPFSSATLSGVTVTGGLSCAAASGCDGGGISNAGTLTLNKVMITGNAARTGADQSTPGTGAAGGDGHNGGGIYNYPTGRLTVTDSAIVGNAAGSGGAGADGAGNNGGSGGHGGSGGGIYNIGGVVTLIDSTISGNTAGAGGTGGLGDPSANPETSGGPGGPGGNGGGIASVPDIGSTGQLTATNVTVAGNVGGAGGADGLGNPGATTGLPGAGGGIMASTPASLTNVTVAANSAGGSGDGVDAVGGILTEYGSVIAVRTNGRRRGSRT